MARLEGDNIAAACKDNSKKFWNYVNSRTKCSRATGDFRVKVTDGTEVILKDDANKAEHFSNFFVSVYNVEGCNEYQ